MSVSILSIGTELTRGEITNTNCTWLCERATALGLDVTHCETIADDHNAIRQSLERLAAHSRVLLCTGGLGPTTDDITAQAVAKTLGVSLIRHEESYARLVARLTARGRAMTDSNAKQVDLPEGASVLLNAHGTAPGFSVELGATLLYFMPGVPSEMKPMFEALVAPKLLELVSDFTACIRLHTFGAPESSVNDSLAGIEEEHQVTIGYRAHFPEIEVKVLARRAQRTDAERVAKVVATEIETRLSSLGGVQDFFSSREGKVASEKRARGVSTGGRLWPVEERNDEAAALQQANLASPQESNLGHPLVFGRDQQTLVGVVADALRSRGLRLALAESCTGGHLADLVTSEPASDYFQGAVVCYSNEVKQSLLGVSPATLNDHGAVSLEVVREMAQGARKALAADVALAISGIAGPSGGSAEKPVGTVCIALSAPNAEVAERFSYSGSRRQVQQRAAFQALDMLRRVLGTTPLPSSSP